jgi:O-antigen biosynthesis protein
MKITAIRCSTLAVGEYRIRHPMLALRDLGHETHVITLEKDGTVRICNKELIGDILVLGRITSPEVFDLLESIPERLRPRVIYEIDDDPWEWHSWDPVHVKLGANYSRAVTGVMSRCDAITCTTRTLAARIRREMPDKPIWVIPNAIDYTLRDWTARESREENGLEGKVVLGWTGSIHHERDGQMMLEAVPEILAEYPEAVLLLQCDRNAYGSWTDRLKRQGLLDRVYWAPPVPFDIHPGIYSLFDINLAPLEMTQFNLCKSDLRLIEGGAQGVPYVASNIAPYTDFHEHSDGIGGYLASTPAEWVEALEDLLDCPQRIRGAALSSYVRETRALSVVAGQWQAAFEAVLAGSEGEAVSARQIPGRNDPCPCGSGTKYKRCHSPAYGG